MWRLRFVFIVVVAFLLLGVRFWFYYSSSSKYVDGQVAQGVYVVDQEPEIRGGGQRFRVSDGSGVGIWVRSGVSPRLKYGDKVFIDGFFTVKESNGRDIVSIYYPKFQTINLDENILTKCAFWIKNKAQSMVEVALPHNSGGLLLGIIFGGKYGLERDFEDNLRVTGVMHVIAASGMNVAFVAGALMSVLGSVMKRRVALIVAGFGIVFYMFLASFEESIVRAGIMALMAFGASFLGRQYLGLYALGVTLIGMLAYDPGWLFDVGFQLSFLATLGILVVKPILDELGKMGMFRKMGGWGLGSLGQDLSTTVAAQVGVMPVILSTFGSVGLLSVLVNVVVLWTIPIIMTFGVLALILGIFFEPIGQIILYLCLPFLLFFEWTVSFFGRMGMVWEIGSFGWEFGVGYYLLIVSLVLVLRRRGLGVKEGFEMREKIGI